MYSTCLLFVKWYVWRGWGRYKVRVMKTGSSVHIIAVPLDRHKAVLATFMRLQEHLLPSGPSFYLQSKNNLK